MEREQLHKSQFGVAKTCDGPANSPTKLRFARLARRSLGNRGMASRRAHPAAIAAASDGSVLINVVGLLPEAVQERLQQALGALPLFVGVALSQREAGDVVARLDGAAAEASAHLLGGRSASRASSRPAKPRGPRKVQAKRR